MKRAGGFGAVTPCGFTTYVLVLGPRATFLTPVPVQWKASTGVGGSWEHTTTSRTFFRKHDIKVYSGIGAGEAVGGDPT